VTCQQILLTCLNEGPKVEEYEITGTKSKYIFLQGLKPKFAHIIETKRGINPKKTRVMLTSIPEDKIKKF